VINDNTVVLSCPGVRSRANRPQQPICHADDDSDNDMPGSGDAADMH